MGGLTLLVRSAIQRLSSGKDRFLDRGIRNAVI